MDCNNYSYSNTSEKSNIIAYCEKGFSGYPVTFEICENWFGDRFYYVSDLFGDCAEFHITRKKDAAQFYNSLVPDNCAVPLF